VVPQRSGSCGRRCLQESVVVSKGKRGKGEKETYPLLVVVDFIVGNGVGLGNYRNEVDLGVKLLHHLNVDGLQGVAGGLDEVDNGMDTVVDDVHAVDLVLSIQVCVEPLLNVLDNGIP
jgi:hypothetical protein